MDMDQLLAYGTLTLVMGGVALWFAPPEKRSGFLLHITLVTILTLIVITMDR